MKERERSTKKVGKTERVGVIEENERNKKSERKTVEES